MKTLGQIALDAWDDQPGNATTEAVFDAVAKAVVEECAKRLEHDYDESYWAHIVRKIGGTT